MSSSTLYDLAVKGDIVLEGGKVFRDGWLGAKDGLIVELSLEPLKASKLIDSSGYLIFPGFVDGHVHTRSYEGEGITATTRAAAAGGTTTIVDMPFDKPERPVSSLERLRAKIEDVGSEAMVDVGLWATFTPEGDLDNISEMASAGAAAFEDGAEEGQGHQQAGEGESVLFHFYFSCFSPAAAGLSAKASPGSARLQFNSRETFSGIP